MNNEEFKKAKRSDIKDEKATTSEISILNNFEQNI